MNNFGKISSVTGLKSISFIDVNDYSSETNKYFSRIDFPGGTTTDYKYDSWGNRTIALYSGIRTTGNDGALIPGGGRAFNWHPDPPDPEKSSPWHNIIYESVIGSYVWGCRNFFLYFPFGGSRTKNDSVEYPSPVEYLRKKEEYTSYDGNTPDWKSPAMWKGFKESIKNLIEGNMVPDDPTRPPINNPCDVILYLPSFMGYPDYRELTTTYWNSLGANDAVRDAAFSIKLNDYIDDLKYMAGNTPNRGKLRFCFDVSNKCAVPWSIGMFRTINAKQSGETAALRYNPNKFSGLGIANADGITNYRLNFGIYKSDVLELADWTVKTELEKIGIDVFTEARPAAQNVGAEKYPSVPNPFSALGCGFTFGWKSFIAAEFWLWVTDPENPTRPSNCANTTPHGVWNCHIKNGEAPLIVRFTTNGLENYYFSPNPNDPTDCDGRTFSSDPFGLPGSVLYTDPNGSTAAKKLDDYKTGGTNLYESPFFYLHTLYCLSDNYRLYDKLNKQIYDKYDVKLKQRNLAIFNLTHVGISFTRPFANKSSSSTTEYYVANMTDASTGSNHLRLFLNTSAEFNGISFLNNPKTYNRGFWLMQDEENWQFWNNNVRKSSYSGFVDFIKTFSEAAFPKNTPGISLEQIYPNDYWSSNILKRLI